MPALRDDKKAGAALLAALLYLTGVSLLAASFLGLTRMTGETVSDARWREGAFYLAEAGVAHAMAELDRAPGYTGDANLELGDGRFTVSVERLDFTSWRVTSSGEIGDADYPRARAVVEADVTHTEAGVRRAAWRRLR